MAKDAPQDALEQAIQAVENAWFNGSAVPLRLPGTPDQQDRLARLLGDMLAAQGFALNLSKGDLAPALPAKGLTAGALKALQANLRHLTWQTQMIARGDFSQRVDFMGEFSVAFNSMVAGLAAARDQLLAANQDLEAFSYSVAHDLRAPLRAIEGFSRIILEDYAETLDLEGQRLLEVIIKNVQHLARLIDNLLTFCRSGRQEVEKIDLDMTVLARSIAGEIQAWAPDRTFQVIITPALPPALGDHSLITQVWVNLLTNAVKFTAQRDPAIIEVGGYVEEETNVYFVRDNGVGFDPAQAERLFVVFQRLHRPSEFEGTGLGLAIVHKIIQRHGGRVWAEGRVNEGATFFFSLPRAEN